MSQVSVGRVVHFVSRGSLDGVYPPTCRAAIVTEVDVDSAAQRVGLCVISPSGYQFLSLNEGGAENEETGPDQVTMPGTWHWPERV